MRPPFGWQDKRLRAAASGVAASEEPEGERVYGVSELNRSARLLLERQFPDVWVEGEISDLRRPASGHLYFRLNDEREQAQLACVLFRNDARRSKATLVNGGRVRLRGQISLFEPRGGFQLIARVALPAGEGDLRARLIQLQKKLAAEGLLDPARKRPLPLYPRVIGVVTSRAAAALHDVIRVAQGRAPVRLVLSPCMVQGARAPSTIVEALRRIQRLPELDLVILTRGGGSSEDLSAFNDESVARAVAACRVPVVSGVGHEVDLSLSDLVADVRAATPSNAAERSIPERALLQEELSARLRQLQGAMAGALGRAELRLEQSQRRLRDPRHHLIPARLALAQARSDLERSMGRGLRDRGRRLRELQERLSRQSPAAMLERDRARLSALSRRLEQSLSPRLLELRGRLRELDRRAGRATRERLRSQRASFGERLSKLQALSPLSVLARGYAIALQEPGGQALIAAEQAEVGDTLRLRLRRGQLRAEVIEILPEEVGE